MTNWDRHFIAETLLWAAAWNCPRITNGALATIRVRTAKAEG